MKYTIRFGTELFSLDEPKVMGILNATPDSFYDSSRLTSADQALIIAEKMVDEGVDIIDVGGQSTRPGSMRIPINQEIDRVLPVIEKLQLEYPHIPLSIDTYYGEVARQAVHAGAVMINDISAWELDPSLFSAVVDLKVPYVLMHMQGRPESMQDHPKYNDVVNDIYAFFSQKITELRQAGVADILIDPGFGFGKTIEHNYALLGRMAEFSPLDCPIMAGVSRKGMIYKLLNCTPQEALNGTTAANVVALMNGASILRVHDVAAAREAVKIVSFTRKNL